MIARAAYRVRQFLWAVLAPLRRAELEQIEPLLPPAQWTLFRRMSPADRRHGLAVYQTLRAQGVQQPDLLAAALLHDAGKGAVRLRLLLRVATVLFERLTPRLWEKMSSGEARGWRRPFVLYRHHAAIGAQWAAEAGCSPLTVRLIRQHEEPPGDDALLTLLQQADESS